MQQNRNIMLKIGVLGAGHLGKIHIKCIKNITDYQLVGFYDPDKSNAAKVSSDFGIKNYESIESLLDDVDVVDIVTPTISHFDCASKAFAKNKHVFIEKPIVATTKESFKLMELANEAGVKVQVGHVERFNPAFLAAKKFIDKPMFIEAHRLSQFNPRGTDVPVILDLMIHDLDIVLSSVQSEVKNISASGVAVVSPTPDIANARIEFENGSVANLTASRISLKNMRKTRIFQKDAYISIDFLEKQSEIVRMKTVDPEKVNDPFAMILEPSEGREAKQIIFEKPESENINAIETELFTFAEAVANGTQPPVSMLDGHKALKVANDIHAIIIEQLEKQQAMA